MKTQTIASCVGQALLLLGGWCGPVAAQTISVNIVGGGFVSGTPAPLISGDVAGVVPASYWNNVAENTPVSSTM